MKHTQLNVVGLDKIIVFQHTKLKVTTKVFDDKTYCKWNGVVIFITYYFKWEKDSTVIINTVSQRVSWEIVWKKANCLKKLLKEK